MTDVTEFDCSFISLNDNFYSLTLTLSLSFSTDTLKDFDPESLKMRSVITYKGREDRIVWVNLSIIHWPGNWVPSSDVDVCHEGIADLHCNKHGSLRCSIAKKG